MKTIDGLLAVKTLLRDRGLVFDQQTLAKGLRQPSTVSEIVQRLNELSGPTHHWVGGQFDIGPSPQMLAELSRHGSWAVQLIQPQKNDDWLVVNDPSTVPLAEITNMFGPVIFETGK